MLANRRSALAAPRQRYAAAVGTALATQDIAFAYCWICGASMSAPENAAREQAVAPGQRRYRLRGQGISQGFAFGANPVPCAHIRCRVPSPRPYRPDHDLVDCGRCPCATTILPLTRPDYSVVARRPTSPQGDYSLTLSSFGTTRIRRVDLVTTGLSSADFTGTLGGTVKRPLTG